MRVGCGVGGEGGGGVRVRVGAVFRIHMFLGFPDPDPLVRYGFFYHQASVVRKTLIPTDL